jgi:hypothetical protein
MVYNFEYLHLSLEILAVVKTVLDLANYPAFEEASFTK